jgi:membrane protease YdiL (CAAX protease family)
VRCALTVVALFAVLLLAGPVGAAVTAVSGGDGPAWLPLAGTGLAAVVLAVAAVVALARFVDRRPVAQLRLGCDRRTPLWLLGGTVVAFAAGAAAVLVAVPLGVAVPVTSQPPAGPSVVVAMLVLAFLVQGVPEEVLFRGYLVRTSADRLPVWGVVVVSSVLFGALHILSRSDADTSAERVLFAVMAVGLGASATAARLAAGSVWAAVGVHGGFHVTTFVLASWWVPTPEAYGAYLALLAGTQLVAAAVVLRVAVGSGRLRWRERLAPEH